MTVPQERRSHVDGTLVMGNHHRNKVAIDITRWSDLHILHHPAHGIIVLGQEWRFG
jgi:hypothetical protein